jgi:hypothetical protein
MSEARGFHGQGGVMSTNVSPIESKIKVEETSFDGSVSESLMQRIGGNINRLIDEKKRTIIHAMTTSGTRSWVCPQEVYEINVTCVGGGGGGVTSGTLRVGGGGGGIISGIAKVVPGTTYSFTVGAGGTAGNTGGTSSMSGFCQSTGGQGGSSSNPAGEATLTGRIGGAPFVLSSSFYLANAQRGGSSNTVNRWQVSLGEEGPNFQDRQYAGASSLSPSGTGSTNGLTFAQCGGAGSFNGNGATVAQGGGGGGYSSSSSSTGGTGAVIISYQLGRGITDNVPA